MAVESGDGEGGEGAKGTACLAVPLQRGREQPIGCPRDGGWRRGQPIGCPLAPRSAILGALAIAVGVVVAARAVVAARRRAGRAGGARRPPAARAGGRAAA